MDINLIAGSAVYALLGILIMAVAFVVIDKLTPGDLWRELLDKQNTAIAIVAAGVAIAVGLIIASAIH